MNNWNKKKTDDYIFWKSCIESGDVVFVDDDDYDDFLHAYAMELTTETCDTVRSDKYKPKIYSDNILEYTRSTYAKNLARTLCYTAAFIIFSIAFHST